MRKPLKKKSKILLVNGDNNTTITSDEYEQKDIPNFPKGNKKI